MNTILCGLAGLFVKNLIHALRIITNCDIIYITITHCEVEYMDIAKTIKELREGTGMSRKEFSEHTMIPVRTIEDWEAGRRTPPEYIPRLIEYQLKYEKLMIERGVK